MPVSPTQNPKFSDLSIGGMTCASCVRRVEKALAKVPGGPGASVNYATERARVIHGADVLDSTLIHAVEKAGYQASHFVLASITDESAPANHSELYRLVAAFALTVPAVLLSMLWSMRPEWANWVLFSLATPVVFVCGSQFFSIAWKSAVHGSANMDTLVALGAGAAWASSVYGLFVVHGPMQSEFVYFETGSTIVTLILLGRYLESRAKHTMSDAVGKLLDLAPKMATLLTPQGEELRVPADSLFVGDTVRVKPGEKAAVDGVVTEGDSYFDESLLTGEPAPVRKQPGDSIVGGSLNGSGSIAYRVSSVVGESRLAQIAQLVEDAQGSKAPVQKLADRVSAVFVPVVILIALLTFLARWLGLHQPVAEAMLPAIAVLVIACPCALGLATPTAIVAGTGRGAQLGILIRDGEVLERAQGIKTILLDKTGTLTEGHPSVTGVESVSGYTNDQILQLAASLEVLSEHPIGKAIVDRSRELGLELSPTAEFASHPGLGISGLVETKHVRVGNSNYATSTPEGSNNFIPGLSAARASGEQDAKPGARAVPADPNQKGFDRYAAPSTLEGSDNFSPGLSASRASGEGRATPGVDEPLSGPTLKGSHNSPPFNESVRAWEMAGQTVVHVVVDDRVVGVVAVSDPIRSTTHAAIREMKAIGLTPIMLTGDHRATAAAVAATLGIDHFVAEVLPEQKANVVHLYQSGTQLTPSGSGSITPPLHHSTTPRSSAPRSSAPTPRTPVLMVGDGVNDAPALAAADVGIAMGAGSDIAKETAGITLLRNDLQAVPQAIRLARRTMATIHGNLIWAFGYNVIAIPIAVLGHLNPMIAAGAMAFSSISVVLNSLRLRTFN